MIGGIEVVSLFDIRNLLARIILSGLLVSSTLAAHGEAVNLLLNPGFEVASAEGGAAHWGVKQGAVVADEALVVTDQITVKLEGDDCAVYQEATVKPNTVYTASVWMKADNIVPADGSAGGMLYIGKSPSGDVLADAGRIKGNSKWQKVAKVFKTEDYTSITFGVYLRNATGALWVDNASLMEGDHVGSAENDSQRAKDELLLEDPANFVFDPGVIKDGTYLLDGDLQKNGFPFDFFPITPWCSHYRAGLDGIAECNFTVGGCLVDPNDLPLCKALGLKAIVESKLPRYWRALVKMSDAEIDAHVKNAVAATKDDPTVLGYLIIDEPGAFAFKKIGVAVSAVKKYAPGKLAYINLYPSTPWLNPKRRVHPDFAGTDSYADYLDRFVKEVKPQFISYDNYLITQSNDLEVKGMALHYFENLLMVRRAALMNRIPFWNFIGACRVSNHNLPPTHANMSLYAFSSLAAGSRGLTWFRYYDGAHGNAPVADPGAQTRTAYWVFLQGVNRQIQSLAPTMMKLTSTGVYFTANRPEEWKVLPALPGRLVKSVDSGTPVMVGEFRHENGDDYVMLVNLSLERSTQFVMHTVEPYTPLHIVSSADGSLRPYKPGLKKTGGRMIDLYRPRWLTPGQGILVKLSRQNAE